MKKNIFRLVIFLSIIGALLILYSKLNVSSLEANCIPAKELIAYKVSSNIPAYPETPVLPTNPWVVESISPNLNSEVINVSLLQDGEEFVWVKVTLSDTDFDYYLYNIKSKVWSEVAYKEKVFKGRINILKMFTDKERSVWVFNEIRNGQNIPILGKYNSQNMSLSLDKNSSAIPSGDEVVLLDSKNIFWVLKSGDAIYRYDTKSGKIERKISLENQFISSAVLGLDEDIYFLDRNKLIQISDDPANMYRKGAIYKYNVKKNEVLSIPYRLEPTPFPVSLTVDNLGAIWFDGLGWLDSNGDWYQVNRSPLFITTNLDLAGGNEIYRWQGPRLLLESSNGEFWFQSPNGMTSLNLNTNEWCWFTTYKSNIVEDSDHNLWMIADGKLYKNSLEK